mmetsp:Transcript_21762/g.21065  ORF Transcript_21762/g.21065 Transcript_21762/m.21065 type:complete len:520 (+) Transcript_21762:119-1678(+)
MQKSSWINEIQINLNNSTNAKIITFIFVLIVTSYLCRRRRKRTCIVTVPGYPIIGNLMTFMPPDKVFRNIDACVNKYGSMIEMWLINNRIVVVSDLTIIKQILTKRPKMFCRSRAMQEPAKLFGLGWKSGVFFAEGESWSRQRRLTSPPFSHKNIALMSSSIALEVDSFISRLRKLADGKTVLEIDNQIFFYTSRVISSVAFGEKMSQDCHDYFFSQILIDDMNAMFMYLLSRTLFPFSTFFWRLTPQSKTEDTASLANARFSKYCMKMITQKKEAKAINASQPSTGRAGLLDIMIGTRLEGESPLTDYEILGIVKVFFFAGSDTTSVTLSWCLYHLCVDKELLMAMQKEVDGILSLNVTGEEAIAAIPHLPLCSACFKEALRLKPPGELIILEPLNETVELSNGVEVKMGDELWVNISVNMVDPKVFSEPLEFRPSRWLETSNTPEKLVEMNASFTAFGHGPRVCPGQALAFSEGISALVAVTRNFDLKLGCPEGEIERVCRFVTKPNKLPIIISIRE